MTTEQSGEELASDLNEHSLSASLGAAWKGAEELAGEKEGWMDGGREAQLGAGLWRAPLAGSAARAAPVAGPPAAPAEAAPEPAERSGEFPLPRKLLRQGRDRDRDGSARGRGKRRQKWRWSEAGCRRTAGAAQTAPRKSLAEAAASREEQTFEPAFVENLNPNHAEIFNRENKTIKNSQIIENIS